MPAPPRAILSDDERKLLRYYAETDRIIHGLVRPSISTYSAWATSKKGKSSRKTC
jgi:hypothetical protein